MAKNWTAYEAAVEIVKGTNKTNVCEIGSRFPMLTREVAVAGDKILVILKALPKVTARVLETGLKESGTAVVEEATEDTEDEAEEETAGEDDYSSMTAVELYKLCCKRGLSGKCKSRKKDALIVVLEKADAGEDEAEEKPAKKTTKKAVSKKKAEPVEDDEEDDWGDDEEEEEKDPYAGKSAMELFKLCKERGIKAKPKMKADAYVKLLKAADEEPEEEETEDDDEDDWEI